MSINGYIEKRRAMVIIVDECVMTRAAIEAAMQKHKDDLEAEVMFMDSNSQLLDHDFCTLEQHILGFGSGMSKTSMLVQAMVACMPRECDCYNPDSDGYGDWRDFIKNPARPKQKGRAYKAPKQSFRAQMRSVNRNP